jgi:hypothetical protein
MITVGDDNRVQLFNVTSTGHYELATTMAGKQRQVFFLWEVRKGLLNTMSTKYLEMPTFQLLGIIHQINLQYQVKMDQFMYGIFVIVIL